MKASEALAGLVQARHQLLREKNELLAEAVNQAYLALYTVVDNHVDGGDGTCAICWDCSFDGPMTFPCCVVRELGFDL